MTTEMMFIMFRSSHYFKIRNTVVFSIFVLMMNYFGKKKFSPDILFHNRPMFKNIGIINPNSYIATAMANFFMTIFKNSGICFIPTFV